MTRPNRHRVQRQIVELAVDAGTEAPAVHQALARPFWDHALPELESVFDRAAGPDELLRLDRLEIDLGSVDGVDWTTEFRRKLIAELARSLEAHTASTVRDGNVRPAAQLPEPWQQFLFFLMHGRLPWWGTKPGEGWTEALFENAAAAGWSALRETVHSHPDTRARLVYSVADAFLDAAVVNWSGPRHAARVFEQLTPKGLRGEQRQRWRRGFWSLVLDWVSASGFRPPRSGPQLVGALFALRRTYASDIEWRGSFQPSSDVNGQRSPIRTTRDGDLPEPWQEWHRSQDAAASFEAVSAVTRTEAGATSDRAATSSPPRESATRDAARPAVQDDAIYFGGAGTILLHPFFEQLFRERGLLAGRNFRDIEARHRAVHLIGLLTFGIVDVPEYELVLAKAICGVQFEEPLEPVELQDDDIAACDALLHAVLEHWTALRSSSPEWLRQHFFLREGKLERADSGYLLTIERRAQDVLLTKLPWGCGVVALPWLAERMFVRWLD